MADEKFVFNFSDGGSLQSLIEAMNALGLTGDQIISKLERGYVNLGNSAAQVEAKQKILNEALNAGVTDTEALSRALIRLTDFQVVMAANTESVAASIAALATVEKELATTHETLVASIREAAVALEAEKIAAENVAAAFATVADAAKAFKAANVFTAEVSALSSLSAAYKGLVSTSRAAGTATKELTSAFGGLTGVITGLFAASLFVHSIDATDNLSKQMGLLKDSTTGAGLSVQQQSVFFNQMVDAANRSQMGVEAFGKAFNQIRAGVEQYGFSAKDALTVTDSLSQVFYKTGTSADAAGRALHEFAEGLASGAINGRQLRSIEQQAGAAWAELAKILNVSTEALDKQSQATERSHDRVTKLRGDVDALSNSNGEHVRSSSSVEAALNRQDAATDKLRNHTTNLNLSTKEQAQAQKDLNVRLSDGSVQTGKLNTQLQVSRDHEAAATQAKIDSKNAEIRRIEATEKANEALTAQHIIMRLTSEDGQAMVANLNVAAANMGTIKGALAVLNNEWLRYLYNTDGAATSTSLVSTALGLVGRNLNIIIPALAIYFGLLVVDKVDALATSLGKLAVKLYNSAIAQFLLNSALAPFAAGMAIILGPFILWLAYLGKLPDLIAGTKYALDQMKSSLVGTAFAADGVASTLMDKVGKALSGNTGATDTLSDAVGKLTGANNGDTSSLYSNTSALNANTAAKNANAAAGGGGGSGLGAGGGFSLLKGGSSDVAVYQKTSTGNMHSANDIPYYSQTSQNSDGSLSHYNTTSTGSNTGFQNSVNDTVQTLGSFATGGVAQFTVPGGGGTDNRVIRVSPGERVTVQTPQQYYSGTINHANDNTRNFRDGGTFAPDAAFHPTSGGVTGYSLVKSGDYTFTSTLYAAATAITQAVQTIASAVTSAASTVSDASNNPTGVTTINTGSGAATDSTTASGSHFDNAGYNAAVAAWNKRVSDAIRNYSSIGGVSKPPVNGIGWSPSQSNTYSTDGQKISLNAAGNFFDGHGGSRSVYSELQLEAKQSAGPYPKQTDYIKARDGVNFTVPGSSGTDNTLVRMAVSPGERVSVQTPQQQRESSITRVGGSGAIIQNITFNTPDANSFRKSQAQVMADLRNAMRKAG